jgi:rod shape-determining protein MreD
VIRRILAIAIVCVTALLLQSTVFAELRLFGVRPELLYMVTILIAFLEGPNEGTVVGFFAGLFQDFMLNEPKGLTALTLTLVGYGTGVVRQFIVSSSPLLPTVLVGVGTAAGLAFHEIVSALLGNFPHTAAYGVKVALLAAVYNAVLTPIVYPVIRRVVVGSRPRRVVRF